MTQELELQNTSDATTAAAERRLRRAVSVGFALSGGAALIYEVAWTRELSLVFSSTVYAVSTMLAAFMTGLSLGGYLGGRRADREGADLARDLAAVEFMIGVFGLMSVLAVRLLPAIQHALLDLMDPAPGVFFLLQMVLAFLVMLAPTTLMGATFPIVSKLSVESFGRLGRSIGNLYSLNTLGAIGGSLAAGFLLIPFIGVRYTVLVAAMLNALVSVIILAFSRGKWRERAASATVMLLVAGVGMTVMQNPAFPLSLGMASRFGSYQLYQQVLSRAEVKWTDENAYSRVTVFSDGVTGTMNLANGSLIEGGTDRIDRTTTSLLALLPAAYAGSPGDGLVVGLGTGMTTEALLSLGPRSVTTVEINPSMDEAAALFTGDMKSDERWRLVESDARQRLMVDPTRYDVITSEPSWPLASGVSPLFTKEFFETARSRLKPGGVFCQWVPQYLLPKEDFMILYKTFHSVFPNSRVWIVEVDGERSRDMFIVGTNGLGFPDEARIARTLKEQLAVRGLPESTPAPYPNRELLAQAVSDPKVPYNTDDRPILEYHVPWSFVDLSVAQLDAQDE